MIRDHAAHGVNSLSDPIVTR